MALELISQRQPALLQPYKDLLLDELQEQPYWHVLYRICTIVPRLALRSHERAVVSARLEELVGHPQNVLSVNALEGLALLARDDAALREMVLWLLERGERSGSKAMKARCRKLLPKLQRA